MISNADRVGRSAYYEQKAVKVPMTKREVEAKRQINICLNCTEKKCKGNCKRFRRM